jgi:NADP-dependent 3-hydroxy acid dehydrogenase YdfG
MADAHSKPVWFITGCSTGFGRELSVILLKRGYRVVVTARDKTKVDGIVAGHDKNGLALALDVDKQNQIDAAVKAAEARFGRIDVLVNNAGYGYLAAIEEGDDAEVRAMFDTNFFGLAAMTRAVLPIMRAQKSGRSSTSPRLAASSVFPVRVITRRRSSPSRGSPRRCRRKSRRWESRSSSSSPAPSAPIGPAAP